MHKVISLSGLVFLAASAQACGADRTLDPEIMQEITAACGLQGSQFLLKGGQTFIDVHFKYRGDRTVDCMQTEIVARKLANGLHFGTLGDNRPRLTAEQQQRCVDDLVAKQGLDAVDNLDAKCGPR